MNLALTQLTRSLESRLVPYVDLSDLPAAKQADPHATERFSRALAAAAVGAVLDVEDRLSAQSVTDGSDDRGIDAVYVDTVHNSLLLVQSKWSKDGRGSISKGDILKFFDGYAEMVDFDWDVFNDKIRSKRALIEQVLMDTSVSVILCVVTSSDTALSGDAKRAVARFLRDVNTPGLPEMVTFRHLTLSEVHSSISGKRAIHLDATLENWGPVGEPYSAQYGVINATDLADWYEVHGERLFDANIRQALGKTPANDSIRETLLRFPTEFWYLNNGVTVLAQSISKVARGGASRTQGVFQLKSASVVNGAQTVSTIHSARNDDPDALAQAKVAIRFISLEGCPPDFAARVTRATNTQNAVESRDFVSLDSVQDRLRTDFLLQLGKVYSVRRGETAPAPNAGCTVVDATIALACRRGPAMAVLAKATIGRIWDSIGKPPYSDLFNESTSAIDVWRSVQVMRLVDDALEGVRRANTGRASAFAVQGNRLVLALVFELLPRDLVVIGDAEWDALLLKVPALTQRVAKRMTEMLNQHFAENYLAALTKNSGRSRALFDLSRKGMKSVK